jgi:diadenosine tetraphosphate (Ap4A) HIT family hydrolase
LVEHAYPVKRPGWLVIVLKRHTEALHELISAEFAELAQIQFRAVNLLHEASHCQKEYVSCYAEAEHFYHIHFHVFAKPHDLSPDLIGGKSFALLKVPETEAVSRESIGAFCEQLRERW